MRQLMAARQTCQTWSSFLIPRVLIERECAAGLLPITKARLAVAEPMTETVTLAARGSYPSVKHSQDSGAPVDSLATPAANTAMQANATFFFLGLYLLSSASCRKSWYMNRLTHVPRP